MPTTATTDATTRGDWPGRYGALGATVAGVGTPPPLSAGARPHRWADPTADPRALRRAAASGPADRVAGCWYDAAGFTLTLAPPAGARFLSLHLLDWDRRGRVVRVEAPGFDPVTASGFGDGAYLTFEFDTPPTAPVPVRVTRTAGDNAVVSGVFWDATRPEPGPVPPPPPPDPYGDVRPDPAGAAHRPRPDLPLYGPMGPQLSDVVQGSIGNCWMVGTGDVAQWRPDAITDVLRETPTGTVLCRLGGTTYHLFRTAPDGVVGSPRGCLWWHLIVKAYAVYRSERFGRAPAYGNLNGGWADEVYRALGGAVGMQSVSGDPAAQLLDRFGHDALSLGVLTAGTSGLVGNHMYAVTFRELNADGTLRRVGLYNPWGSPVVLTPDRLRGVGSGVWNWADWPASPAPGPLPTSGEVA